MEKSGTDFSGDVQKPDYFLDFFLADLVLVLTGERRETKYKVVIAKIEIRKNV